MKEKLAFIITTAVLSFISALFSYMSPAPSNIYCYCSILEFWFSSVSIIYGICVVIGLVELAIDILDIDI